jgi:hypothetical protein
MPITEVIRTLATARGQNETGDEIPVDLRVDTDGSFGKDADAMGFPCFWISVPGELLGPFEHEDEAVEAAENRFSARFE